MIAEIEDQFTGLPLTGILDTLAGIVKDIRDNERSRLETVEFKLT